jgi:RNA polymerase sigma-70 factor (ECF subfamily)
MPDTCPTDPPPTPSRAFVALMPDLRRAARRLTRSTADADDLVQETLLRVWSRMAMVQRGQHDGTPVLDLRAYAFTTLRNCARTRPPGPPQTANGAPDTRADPGADPEARALATEALRALSALPDDQRRLMRLRALDGLSYSEIAAETGLPMGTVTSRLARGRRALRAALELPSDAPLADLFPPPSGGR